MQNRQQSTGNRQQSPSYPQSSNTQALPQAHDTRHASSSHRTQHTYSPPSTARSGRSGSASQNRQAMLGDGASPSWWGDVQTDVIVQQPTEPSPAMGHHGQQGPAINVHASYQEYQEGAPASISVQVSQEYGDGYGHGTNGADSGAAVEPQDQYEYTDHHQPNGQAEDANLYNASASDGNRGSPSRGRNAYNPTAGPRVRNKTPTPAYDANGHRIKTSAAASAYDSSSRRNRTPSTSSNSSSANPQRQRKGSVRHL